MIFHRRKNLGIGCQTLKLITECSALQMKSFLASDYDTFEQ